MPDADLRGVQEASDRFLRSRWRRLVALTGQNQVIIPYDKDRIALNYTIFNMGIFSSVRMGGPTGVNGIIMYRITAAKLALHFRFNIDNDPTLTRNDVWIDAVASPVDVITAETWCCNGVKV